MTAYRSTLLWKGSELPRPAAFNAGAYRYRLQAAPFSVTVTRRRDGRLVQELVWSETAPTLTFRTGAAVFGLGEGAAGYDRRGRVYPMSDGWGAANRPVYGSRISIPFVVSPAGWGLFLAGLPGQKGEFDLKDPSQGTYHGGDDPAARPVRVFLFAGDPAGMLGDYTALTGRAPMPPKWVLGYMQSHRTLAGPGEVLGVARTFREKNLPCDAVIYLGTGYCPAGWNQGHGSIEFNPATFDQPKEILSRLHELNLKVILHVNRAPRDLHGESIAEASDHPNHIRNYWNRHRMAQAEGADAWWPDDGDELPQENRIARHRAYYEGPLADRPNLRPWALHRTGYAGVARYGGWIWSGDPESRWETLAAHVPVGLNHSVSLTPFWGSDVGGFIPKKELTGELYVRWFQFSAFTSSFRGHGRTWHLRLPWGWNTGELGPVEEKESPDPSELRNAAVEPICRDYLNLRYQLLPYNYTLARESHDTGLPMMRPLWLHYQNDQEAAQHGDQYLWGREILVAPVVEKGVTSRSVYLPEGGWYDWWTGEFQAGGRAIQRKVELSTLPLYARAGAIIPLDPVRQYTGQAVTGPTTIRIYRGADGRFVLYEDDGVSQEYLKGQGTRTRFTWDDRARRLRVEPAAGARPGPEGTFRVRLLPEGVEKELVYKGAPAAVRF
ncbi:MAG TPA: glycoside hydrolase [Solibacterales bacterium]|nr:glycoside hydrolase [Bryobacterales bacterium]